MKIVAHILPFKANNYIIEELIDWDNYYHDPIFKLVFPQKKMLSPNHYLKIKKVIDKGSKEAIFKVIRQIRYALNPHPAGQKEYNVPSLFGKRLQGMQHKYRETILLFPLKGQSCHAFCTFCFRWPQFVNLNGLKFGTKEIENLIRYLSNNSYITDVLITGGDPMIMKSDTLRKYIQPLLDADLPNLSSIRIGSKSLTYWPYRYVSDNDSEKILDLFSEVTNSGVNLAFMAHFNHYNELKTEVVTQAVRNIQKTGTQIRTQSPLLKHINDQSIIWIKLWKQQVKLGLIPYYMFIVRDTGAQHYFSVNLAQAHQIFKNAYSKVSGLARTVRGPSMSCTPGKIEIMGVSEQFQRRVFVLRFIQSRNSKWVNRPFFAKYDPDAVWISDLKPVFSERFFFEKEMPYYLKPYNQIMLDMKKQQPYPLQRFGDYLSEYDEEYHILEDQ